MSDQQLLAGGRTAFWWSAIGAFITGWKRPTTRASLVVAAASSVAGAAATAYVLRFLNPKLFFSPHPLSEDERRPLLTRWYRSTHSGSRPAPWP